MRHQAACGAAVGGRHRVARQAVVPLRHARGDHLVALAARRHEVPLVVLALRNVHWVAVMQLPLYDFSWSPCRRRPATSGRRVQR